MRKTIRKIMDAVKGFAGAQEPVYRNLHQGYAGLSVALLVLTLTGPASAASIAVPNPSFEAVQRLEGVDDYNKWANTQDVWRHWCRTENGGPVRIWNPGTNGVPKPNNTSSLLQGFDGNAPQSNMVACVRSRYADVATVVPPQWDGVNYFSAACLLLDGTIGTPLAPAAPFNPTKVYRLTATVGKPKVWLTAYTNGQPVYATDPSRPPAAVWHGYALQLAVGGVNSTSGSTYAGRVDGGTIVAQDSNSRAVPVDTYRMVTTTYFPNPADVGLTGSNLQIRLAALDNPADLAMTGSVIFDDVKLDEFAVPTPAYWDLNGTDLGAGSTAPSGPWDATSTFWNAAADGTGATNGWTPGQTAVFAAGGDATGSYTVTVDNTQDVGGLAFQEGDVTVTGGTALRLTQIAMADVASGLTATIETPIAELSSNTQLAKSGGGTLVLSGANTYSGGTTVLGGTLRLGANNVLDDTSPVTLSGWSAGTTTLDLAGNSDTIGGLILGGTTSSSAAQVTTGAGTLTLGGDVAYVNASGTGVNPLGATISGQLDLGAAARSFVVNNSVPAADDLTVSANITGSVAMTKTGKGTLALSGNNVGATGGLTLDEGVTRFESAAAINGTARDVTVTTPGAVVFGALFGAGNIPAVLADRIVAASDGIIAADNYAANNFDFNTPGLGNAFLGAVGDVTYTGSLTPNGTTYRLGGGGGTLTMTNANALTGSGCSLIVGGKVTLTSANNYDGGTILLGGALLPSGPVVLSLGNDNCLGTGALTFQAQTNSVVTGVIQSSDSTARTFANALVLNANVNVEGTGNLSFTNTAATDLGANRTFTINNPVTTFAQAFSGAYAITKAGTGTMILTGSNTHSGGTTLSGGTLGIGNEQALGSGTFTINAGTAVQAAGTVTVTNAVAANGDFSIAGSDPLTLSGTTTLSANRIITNTNVTSTTTFGPITGSNRTLTFSGDGNTAVTGAITTGAGTLTKNGAGTLTLSGTNTYRGATTVNSGTLVGMPGGSVSNSAVTVASAGTLQLQVTDNTKRWTCSSLALNSDSTLTFVFQSPVVPSTDVAPLNITNNVTFTETTVVAIAPRNIAQGKYPLLTVGGTLAPTTVPTLSGIEGRLAWGGTDNKTLYLSVIYRRTLILLR